MSGGASFSRRDNPGHDASAFARRIADRHAPGGMSLAERMPGGGTVFLHKKTAGNYSMSLTVKNDIAVNIRLSMSGHSKTFSGFPGMVGRYMPLSPHVNADYEYHLQKNMIRNIYDTYRSLTEHAGKTASTLITLTKLRDTRPARTDASFEPYSLLRRFAEYTGVIYREIPHPRVLFESRRSPAEVTERRHSESRIKQTVEADFKSVPGAALETVSRTGIKNAAEQVYKKLSEDLRRERLKKGF